MKKFIMMIFTTIVRVYIKVSYYLKRSYEEYNENNFKLLPAHIAFFTMWSLIPIILVWDILSKIVPFLQESDTKFVTYAQRITESDNLSFTISLPSIIIVLVLLYMSSKPFTSIIVTSNYIYGISNKTNFFKTKIKSVIFAFIVLITFAVLLIITVLGSDLVQFISTYFEDYNILDSIEKVSWIFTIVFLTVVLFIIYYFAPSEKISYRFFLPGTGIAAIGWTISTYLYSIYVLDIADYSKIYSGFANVIILMIWIYMLSYILIIGLVVNATYFEEKKNGPNYKLSK